MEGTIHIKTKHEQDYWIEGALVDKVVTSQYDYSKNGREAFVHYKDGTIEEIYCIVLIEILGTYKMEATPIPVEDQEQAQPTLQDVLQKDSCLNKGDLSKYLLEKALRQTNGNRKRAAILLGISDRTMYRRCKQYGL